MPSCTWGRAGPHAATSVPVAEPGVMMVLKIKPRGAGVVVAAVTGVGFVELRLVKVVGLPVLQDDGSSGIGE